MVYTYKIDSEMTASHVPLLTRVFDLSEGDVLEVGTGYFSTLLLHWLSAITKRHVYSYESKPYWYNRSLRYESEFHHIILCETYEKADFDKKCWGMAFIDHSPKHRRPIDVVRLADKAEYIVVHDTDPERDNLYRLGRVWGMFKYRYDYTKLVPWTTVVSNFKDLSDVE